MMTTFEELQDAKIQSTELEKMADEDLLNLGWDVLRDLCDGKRRWTMSIPVQSLFDPDVIFGEIMIRLGRLIASDSEVETGTTPNIREFPGLDKQITTGHIDEDE